MRESKTPLAFVILAALLVASSARADILDPVRDVSRLHEPDQERVVRVATARVILADYALLKRDFPSLRNKSDAEIDEWILDQSAYVSMRQAQQETVNSKIELKRDIAGNLISREAIRPQMYRRALVFPAGHEGLIDMKGAGSRTPGFGSHSNGLATTGEAIREFVVEHKVQQVLEHSGLPNRTVGSYAVIDWGFDVIHDDGTRSPAGAVLRQAHERLDRRVTGGNTFLDRKQSAQIERVLRLYGISSSGERHLGDIGDVINIQGNAKGELVDFGSYLVRPDFKKPAFYYRDSYRSKIARAQPLLDPKKPDFVHPDPRLRLPVDVWGYSVTGTPDPKYDNLWVWSHELAQSVRNGTAQRQDVWNHFQTFMSSGKPDPALAGLAVQELGIAIAPAHGRCEWLFKMFR